MSAVLLAWAMAITFAISSTANAEAAVTHTRTLAPLTAGNNVITQVGTNRGRGMMRESLGISVSSGAVVEARVTNGVGDVTIALTTDDHQQDVQLALPVDGSWLPLTAKKDSAVFARSKQWATAPQIEYRVATGTEHVMPEFRLNNSQATFVQQWAGGTSPFALIVDQAFTMLIPRVDLPKIQDFSWSDYTDLNHVIQSYRHLLGTYNGWLGIDDAHSNPVHHDLPQAYFIRPDINGPGLAYYGPNNAIGTNNNSVSYYLQGPGSWLILHEVGHGYDGMMTGSSGPLDMQLGEVWNNVYAYQYQAHVLGHTSNWLYNNGRAADQKVLDDARRSTNGQNFGAINVRLRLDVLARIAELTGADGFSGFNRSLRELRADPSFTGWPSRTDLIAEHWGAKQGYDLLPWLAQFGLPVSPRVETAIRDHAQLPSVLPLGDYFTDYAMATAAANTLGLASPGQLVSTLDLQTLSYAGSLKAQASIGDPNRIKGRSATVWAGSRLVGQAAFVNGVADFGQLPIGTYTVRFPQDSATGTVPQRQSVKVSQGGNTVASVAYPATAARSAVNATQLSLLGLGDGNFANVVHDPATATFTVNDGLGAPHSYFTDEYARITVTSGTTTLFDRSFIGNAGRSGMARSTTVPASAGNIVTIKHREHNRLVETDANTGAAKPSLNATAMTTQYQVTDHGLIKVGGTGNVQAEFAAALGVALSDLRDTADAQPGTRLDVVASQLRNAINEVTDANQRTALLSGYGALLDGLLRPATVSAAPLTLTSALASQPGQESSHLFDGDLTTAFHSPWNTAVTLPYNIDVSLGAAPIELSSLVLTPHTGGGSGAANGRPGQYRVLIGNDASSVVEVATGTWANDANTKLVSLQGQAKFVRLQILSTYGAPANTYVAARELQIFGRAPGSLTVTMARTDNIATPTVGNVLTFRVTYRNNTGSALTAFPRSSNLAGALTTGTPNCRYSNLAAGATQACTTAKYTVTEADVAAGLFRPALVFDAAADSAGTSVLQAAFVATLPAVEVG
ncbi:putative mucin/carbohydrate-binding domain-containing protein [Tessaracoccus sp. MC1756]|uniref:putative mucin/carbohydrate-binding domain-containing protein n=1 Tax=Tessaracoccus sp. MC1756 TaxID=2760311 RepID=UPI0016018B30|nr:hypothetical protein [Tessaracoccus sp. MC1756]